MSEPLSIAEYLSRKWRARCKLGLHSWRPSTKHIHFDECVRCESLRLRGLR